MPAALERKLKREATAKGFKPGSERWRKYVYGTLRKTGWKPSRERRRGQGNRALLLVRKRKKKKPK